MDQLQPTTSTMNDVQMVPVGSASSMPASIPSLIRQEQMRYPRPVAPYGGGPQNLSTNSSAHYMMPKTSYAGFQQMVVPNNDLRGMGAIFNNTKSNYAPMPGKRKSTMDNMPSYPLSPNVAMPNNKIGQLEHRPWLNTSAFSNINAQHQVQYGAGVLASQQLAAQNKRTIQFQAGPPKSGLQKSSTPRSHPIQGQPSPKVQNQSNESVRRKLRESISAALALVIEKDKSLCREGPSAGAGAKASEQMQEASQSADNASSVSPGELSGEKPTEANKDSSTRAENNLKNQPTGVDCNVGESPLSQEGVGLELNMVDLLPDEESVAGNIFAKDDLLRGNGLAWVLDFDAWVAQNEGQELKKPKIGESVFEAREVKKTKDPQLLALHIEVELFKLFGGVNKKYKEKGRSLLFNLKDKNNPELREKVMSGEISPARLCSMTAEELASKELSEWRIAKAEEFEHMKILPDSDIDIRRLVKKTHKGEFQVEVEDDDVSVEVSVGPSSFPQFQTEAKELVPQSGQESDGGEEKAIDDNSNSEDQNAQCTITIPSNESSDLMQGLIEDELKDAAFLPPIVSLDEFMESLHSEPPFENLPPAAEMATASPNNDHTEVPSETKSAKLSPDAHMSAAFETQHNLDSKHLRVDTATDVKPTDAATDVKPTDAAADAKLTDAAADAKLTDAAADAKLTDAKLTDATADVKLTDAADDVKLIDKSDGEFADKSDAKHTETDLDSKPTDNRPQIENLPPIVASDGDKIWEGMLQLSASSTVAVSGFFKSGEKSPTKDWPRTMEIKGRVRLDAFDKFLQDLYKSQSRSVMVMDVILKNSEAVESEALRQVVDSYVADHRVGFAEPLRGLEVYLCPHHPEILDRIGKHLVKDQRESHSLTGDGNSLIGVIVSRKAHASPNSWSHHKHSFKKHQQDHYMSSRRHNYHQDRNKNVNPSNLTPKFPVVSSRVMHTVPKKAATEEDDLPPGFGPTASQDGDDDLPEFNFSGGLNGSVHTKKPVNRPADQMRQLVQKYGQSSDSGHVTKSWKDNDDDIPEWQPEMTLPTPIQPLNPHMLQHLINQQQKLLQQSQVHVPLQAPMPTTQSGNAAPSWPQSGVWMNPQGQFYGSQSRGF